MKLEPVNNQSGVLVGYLHWCPGCKQKHYISTEDGQRPRWSFDGNMESPTFGPSINIRSGHFNANRPADRTDCWCNYEARTGRKPSFSCGICHYFIQRGQIAYCADSTHALSGQTVPLPDCPAD